MILFFMHLFSLIFHVREDVSTSNMESNERLHLPTTGDGYIDWQEQLREYKYGQQSGILSELLLDGGRLSAAVNSCELIAIYNILLYYGAGRSFAKIIYDMERRGVSLLGYFGTSIKAAGRYLEEANLTVSRIELSYARTDDVEPKRGERIAYIITGLNEKGRIKSMVHSIALTCEGNLLRAHNDITGGRLYPTLSKAVEDFGDGRGSVLSVLMVAGGQDNE